MGLDVSHGAWHGAYSAFYRWRNKVAEVAGYKMVEGQYGQPIYEVVNDPRWTEENFLGVWPDGPPGDDPLMVLLIHSDCGGIIEPTHAMFLAKRLEQLLPLMPEGEGGGHIGDWRAKTQDFIDGLNAAADAGEKVEFG